MAIKARSKTGVETVEKPVVEAPSVTEAMTTVSFRTKLLLKKKAEAVFDDLGITTSAAINMFLTQVVRERGMPFLPTTKQRTANAGSNVARDKSAEMDEEFMALEELWNELS